MSSEEEALDGDQEEKVSEDVIEWSEKLEDRTLAVLEGDIEDDLASSVDDFSDFDGTEGVAKINNEAYVTDFDAEIDFEGAVIEVSVERSGGLNTVEYWSDDPHVMAAFDTYIQDRVRSVEQQPMLDSYKFEDVRSDEVQELIEIYENEFELKGPLPRGSNGQPRMHMLRAEDVNDNGNDFKHSDQEVPAITAEDEIPGDAEYVIEGLANPSREDVEGKLEIKPQKHDIGLYTVTFTADDASTQAYMINTSLRAIDAERDELLGP